MKSTWNQHRTPSGLPRRTTLLLWVVMTVLTQTATAQSVQLPSWQLGVPTFQPPHQQQPQQQPNSGSSESTDTTSATQATSYQLDLPTPPPEAVGTGLSQGTNQIPPPLPQPESPQPALIPRPAGEADEGSTTPPITQAIEDGVTGETPPLAEDTVHWYEVPWRWLTRGWDNHAELGLDGASGNARTLAIQTGLEMNRKTDLYTVAIDFDYRQASTFDTITEDNGRLNIDYDRLLADSPWSAFGKFGMEWDEFKVFDLRLNLNGGAGYHWIRNEDTTLVTRFGAGASKEIGAPDDAWKPEAVFGLDASRQINRYNKMKAKVDFFPAWEDFSDYRLVSDLAWEILLDDSDNLSLKLALTDRYDSTPQGARPNDVYYSVLLLVKF